MATFNFELVSPERMLFSGPVTSVVAPGSEGEFQVFAGHAPVMTALKPGVVAVDAEGGGKRLFVRGGFAEVNGASMTILAEHAVDLAELSREKLAAEIKDAEEDVADAKDAGTKAKAQARLDGLRALSAAAAH
jgi:F-type H+-transporting ATPase subunit epsilon